MRALRPWPVLVLTTLAGAWSTVVHAEDTAADCRDGADDDRDGLVGCADPGCSLFVFCAPPAGRTVASVERAEGPEPEPVFALTVNLGGAATFGPSLGVELGGVVTGAVFVRAMNAGVLNYVLASEHSDFVDDQFDWGVGAGAQVRLYISRGFRGMRGFWIGLAAEYQLAAWSSPYYRDEVHSVAPSFQLGWRWIWGSFVLGIGASAGYSIPVDHTLRCGDAICEEDDFTRGGAVYLVHVELVFSL